MKKNRDAVQKDLFLKPEDDLRRKVRELDMLIAGALKKQDFERARALTARQEEWIRALVENTEKTVGEPERKSRDPLKAGAGE